MPLAQVESPWSSKGYNFVVNVKNWDLKGQIKGQYDEDALVL